MPPAPRRSMLAPRCSSSFATRSCPPPAAPCSSPYPFLSSASTSPLFCTQSRTGCSSPRHAAFTVSAGRTCGIDAVEAWLKQHREQHSRGEVTLDTNPSVVGVVVGTFLRSKRYG
eukprot:scaffold13667_cov68-Phaeocystis_antarctica.AAC.2